MFTLTLQISKLTKAVVLNSFPQKNAKYIPVIEILLALILVDGRGTLTSKERTFVVLQLVTQYATFFLGSCPGASIE
jgi:lipoprotein signal peptidase